MTVSPEVLAEFYRCIRHDLLRIDFVFDDDMGMWYFQGLLEEDEDTGEEREVVLDDVTKRRYQRALAEQYIAGLSRICPRAVVRVTFGSTYGVTFTRESPMEASDEEIWAAINAFDDNWACDLESDAYTAVLEERATRPRAAKPGSRRCSLGRRRR